MNPEICMIAAEDDYIKKIPFTINGVKAFDFHRDFTIAAWVKWEKSYKYKVTTIIESETFGFGLYKDSKDSKRFHLTVLSRDTYANSKVVFSTDEYRDFYSWQHVAVVFKYPRDIKFYYNGKEWPLKWPVDEDSEFDEPENLKFFYDPGESLGFLALVQRSLSEEEINKLRTTLVL